MSDRATEKRARFALSDLVAGKYTDVATFLAKLAGVGVPELKKAQRSEARVVEALKAKIATLEGRIASMEHGAVNRSVAIAYLGREPHHGPLPKPRRRIRDQAAIAYYVQTHPDCEVIGCRKPPCPEPHHLISRKSHRKGDDVPSNLIRLCEPMHSLYHRNGPRLWLATFGQHLTADTYAKVGRAARAYEEDGPAVELDAVEHDQ